MSREIFQYKVGETSVFGDPICIDRKLKAACGGDWMKLASQAYPVVLPEEDDHIVFANAAEERLIKGIRQAFSLPPFDPLKGTGSPDSEVLDIFDSFTDYRLKKKRSIEKTLTSPQPTAVPT